MELLKFCGGVIVIVSGTLFGIYASKALENRVKFLEQYIMFLTQVKIMISCNAVSVPEILSSANLPPLIKPLSDNCLARLSEGNCFERAWRGSVDMMYAEKLFTESDKTLMYSFGDTFGDSDIEGEVAKTELHISLVSERLNNIKQEFQSKRRLYRIVGMFTGIMITLVIY